MIAVRSTGSSAARAPISPRLSLSDGPGEAHRGATSSSTASTWRHVGFRAARRPSPSAWCSRPRTSDARTAADNIGYPLKLAGVPRAQRRERVEELLEARRRPRRYPSQHRAASVSAVNRPRPGRQPRHALLADEPTSALDTRSTTLRSVAAAPYVRDVAGVTVVVITHEMAVVREICDSVTLLGHEESC